MFACKSDSLDVEFAEMMNDNTLARFDVMNNTDQDIMTVSFEVTFFDTSGDALDIDTVSYNTTSDIEGNQKPFIEAQSTTFFVWSVPENTASASGRVLSYD